jgi:glycosyltransferase involved in cell wall biosynthesis
MYPTSFAAVRLLESEISPNDYDVLWDAGAGMLLHLPSRWDAVPLVADLVDDMVLTLSREIRNAPWSLKKLKLLKYREVNRRFERDCMRRAAYCCVASEDDAAAFSDASPSVPVKVIPNGVDADFFTPSGGPGHPGRVVFEGSMYFPPNCRAGEYLVEEIMPLVWAQRPDASVALVGRDPPPQLLALANERVVVTGAVDDIRPYVQEAEVFACPLRSGAGIKNKLLQAWAMGKAVVATPLSVAGLGARDGENMLIRDGAPALAAAIVSLLADAGTRERLGRAGRQLVRERFTWAAQAVAFDALLADAVAASRRRSNACKPPSEPTAPSSAADGDSRPVRNQGVY